eukprot:gene6905-11100_t
MESPAALKALSEEGDAKAQNAYARMLFDGSNGVAEDRPEAIALWQKSLTVDKVRAEQLFRASALQGNKPAMINLGLMYVNGDGGLPQDLAKAGEWFDRAHPASNFIK